MNNKFLKSTLILSIGGCLTKIIGLFIKIIYTRIIGIEGISLMSLINPTYSLLITLASFNILMSVSMRISSNVPSRKVLVNSCYIMFTLNLVLIIVMVIVSPFISEYLLHNKYTFYPLLACTVTLPFISLGYIVKGYFYGKQNIAPHMISNVLEQLFRLLLIIIILPRVIQYGTVVVVSTLLLLNVVTESFSILILYLFLPKNKYIRKEDLKFDRHETREILNIVIPSISGRLLANVGFFFEPIIFTSILLFMGVDIKYITNEYGIYNAYVVSTLLFPSFLITAISNSLLPEISKYKAKGDYELIKKRSKESILISLGLGVICTLGIAIMARPIMNILYDTTDGVEYIKILAPFFILFYIESPLSTILTALDKIKTSTVISTSGIIIKLLVMSVLGLLNFKIYSLIIAEIINIIYVTSLNYLFVKKALT